MSSKAVAVIGAGPAGLTAAYLLSKQNIPVDIYESSDQVGGLSRSLKLWGQIVDLGSHRFFSRDKRVNELWLEVVGNDYTMVSRRSRIFYRNKFFQYPLQPFDALIKLGPVESILSIFSYLKGKIFPVRLDGSFEKWVESRFGRRLFNLFFKSYSEKLWGIKCGELDADFAAQRIKKFSLFAAIQSAFAKKEMGRHQTLVNQFAYPNQGTGMVYERMGKAILKNGGRLFLKTPVQRVITLEGRVKAVELKDGSVREYDQVISSMPLTTLMERLPEAPADLVRSSSQLTFRNTVFVYLEVEGDSHFEDQWLYIQDESLQTGRISNFRNWCPGITGTSPNSILVLEYWCDSGDDFWKKTDAELLGLAEEELAATKLARGGARVVNKTVVRVPKSYPVYKLGYKKILEPVQKYIASLQGLQAIGRYGAFKYNNQDHSILMGILASENIISSARHDLWAINSDYESYQEDYFISETGLVRGR